MYESKMERCKVALEFKTMTPLNLNLTPIKLGKVRLQRKQPWAAL